MPGTPGQYRRTLAVLWFSTHLQPMLGRHPTFPMFFLKFKKDYLQNRNGCPIKELIFLLAIKIVDRAQINVKVFLGLIFFYLQ